MNKREFLKLSALASIAIASTPINALAGSVSEKSASRKKRWKNWVWINPKLDEQEADVDATYKKYKDAGITGIFFEADSEMHFKTAKRNKLEAHRWLVINKRFDKALMAAHPEWYVVNKNAVSCIEKTAYVERYRWVCPAREEVRQYLENEVHEVLQKDYVDGIHLDCIRYPDVALPVGLWERYNVVLDKELPDCDYCYCDVCREKYKQETGIDPIEIQYADQSPGWRKFRYDQVSQLVDRLVLVARKNKKPITAAVFPTPEIAKRLVRQDWTRWKLDAACPMIYHGQYKEPTRWIGQAVAEGVEAVNGKFPIFAGILTGHFNSADDFKDGIRYALQNGAKGVCIFGKLDDAFLDALKTA